MTRGEQNTDAEADQQLDDSVVAPDQFHRRRRDVSNETPWGVCQWLRLAPAALAAAFVRSKSFVAATIVDATSIAQLTQNIDAAGVTRDDTIHTAIDAIHHR